MGQVLLFGPPGTGKTHFAVQAALELTGKKTQAEAVESGQLSLFAWHPSTNYEDFVRGVEVVGGDIKPKDGAFLEICKRASGSPECYVLIIDEINRGNTISILGELLYGLEWNKRGAPFQLSDGESIVIPNNLLVLATANTADRSIASLDAALGRRFARVEMGPSPRSLGLSQVLGYKLSDLLMALNRRITEFIDREHRIGHAYLMNHDGTPLASDKDLMFAFRYRIVPLLQDYALGDFQMLEQLLGAGFVDVESEEIRRSAFASEIDFADALDQMPGIA